MNVNRKRIFNFIIVCVLFLSLLTVGSASASPISWTNSTPLIGQVNDADIRNSWMDGCRSKFRSIKQAITLVGLGNSNVLKTDCLIASSKDISLLSYNNKQNVAIQFVNENNAYSIRGIDCEISCVYLPTKDIFMTVESRNDVRTGRVTIFNNFVSKLKLKSSTISHEIFYELVQKSPDKIISDFGQDSIGYIKYIQRSSNDRWLIIGFIDAGLFRLDLDSGKLLKFSDWGPTPGSSIEYDITNDGEHIAVGGLNSTNSIFDITPGCGLEMPVSLVESSLYQQQINPCPQFPILSIKNEYLPEARDIYQPQFSDDSGRISFYAMPHYNLVEPKFVTLSISGYTLSQNMRFLGLGDSYSSGEGDTEKSQAGGKYYRLGTDVAKSDNTPKEKCHISTRSYPYILANGMSLGLPANSPLTMWHSVACSGSTAWDVKQQASEAYEGQSGRLLGFDQNSLKTTALNEFIPGRQKQVEFVRKYRPQAITLTMGGNDIGFADKMKACALNNNTCDIATEQGAPRLAKQIQDQYDSLKSLYEEIFSASERMTKIYVVGYPQFINGDKTVTCGDLNIGMLNGSERAAISRAVTYLNNVIKQASDAAGVKFIDIEDSLAGHRLCDKENKYVTGVAFVPPSEVQESFHPNAKGHYEMAMAIWGKVNNKSLLEYTWCSETDKNCPNAAATKETIPAVESYPVESDSKRTVYKQVTSQDAIKGRNVTIKLPSYSMTPGSIAAISLRESNKQMAQSVVSSDGSLDATVVIPIDTHVGPQTIDIDGTTYSEEGITYEQIVTVTGPNENDVDSDGVLDANDPCLFVAPSNKDQDVDGIDDACDPEIGDAPIVSPSPSPSITPSPTPTSTPSPSPSSSPAPSPTVSPSPTPTPAPIPKPASNPVMSLLVSLVKKVVTAVIKIVVTIGSLFGR